MSDRAETAQDKTVDPPPSLQSTTQAATPPHPAGRDVGAPSDPLLVPEHEILDTLGRGGMGVVYKARHLPLNRLVALKMILHADHADENERARFHREAQAIARLQHPNIVQIYEIGEHEGKPYFSLELVPGGSLDRQLNGTPMAPRDAAALVAALAQAIGEAHRAGVIHRDLKPGNVLLTEDGIPRITDFGLAKQVDDTAHTQSGAILGTPKYMAPEQAQGKIHELSPAVDIYALGAILYECLSGHAPFNAANSMALLLRVIREPPVPLTRLQPDVPRDLETICLKCLEKEPKKRYGSGEELAAELQRWLDGEPIVARPVGTWERTFKWIKRRPVLAGLLGVSAFAVLCLVALGVGWGFHLQLQKEKSRTEAQRDLAEKARGEAIAAREVIAGKNTQLEQLNLELASKKQTIQDLLYDADMQWAHQAWKKTAVADMVRQLKKQLPEHTEGKDLRGFDWHYLWNLAHSEKRRIETQVAISTAALSHSEKWLLLGDHQGKVALYDIASGKALWSVQAHTSSTPVPPRVEQVCFSRDDKHGASASRDKTLCIFELSTGKVVHRLKGHGRDVTSAVFSRNGKQLISGSADMSLKIWDVATGKEVGAIARPYQGAPPPPFILALDLSPDGKTLAVGCGDHFIYLWDVESRKDIKKLVAHQQPAQDVCFSPNGRLLASAGLDNTVKVLNLETGNAVLTGKHAAPVNHVAFSSDGRRVISASQDRSVQIWNLNGSGSRAIRGFSGWVRWAAMSRDGHRLLSACGDSMIRIHDLSQPQEAREIRKHKGEVHAIAFSPDGSHFATGDTLGSIHLWETKSGKLTRSIYRGFQESMEIDSLAFSPTGRLLAVAGNRDFRVLLRDVSTGNVVHALEGHNASVTCARFSPNGSVIASGSTDGAILIHEAQTGRLLHALKGHRASARGIAFDPKGAVLASIEGSPTSRDPAVVRLWNPKTGEAMGQWEAHRYAGLDVAIGPEGLRLATASKDNTAKLWDLKSKKLLYTFHGHVYSVRKVLFTSDGKRVATCGTDGTVRLWSTITGQETLMLSGHKGPVQSLCFSPDNSLLLSGDEQGMVRIWNGTPDSP